jgi:hypothetical protein
MHWPTSCAGSMTASSSTSTMTAMALSSTSKPAMGRHRVKAARLPEPIRPSRSLVKDQEPCGGSSKARGGRRLGRQTKGVGASNLVKVATMARPPRPKPPPPLPPRPPAPPPGPPPAAKTAKSVWSQMIHSRHKHRRRPDRRLSPDFIDQRNLTLLVRQVA